MRSQVISKSQFFLLVLFLSSVAGASTPDWLRSLAQQPQKKYADDVNAVILLNEKETTVKDNGEIVTHTRIAYRILRPEGRELATFPLSFSDQTKIISLHGWSITLKGQEYETKDKDAFESSMSTYEVFSDAKVKILLLPGAEVGTVLGFEYERKRHPFVFQDSWVLQDDIPVERSRYTLHLPAGWEYRADWLHHSPQDPIVQGKTYVWETTDIPRIESEYRRPPDGALESTMLVTFFSESLKNQNFRSWNDVALWEYQLTSGTREASDALRQKVQELAPANSPILDRIHALARFAQHDVRYAAIEVGIGGLRPHPAAEIFAHRYGDCKDKATVLMTMLAVIGVKSFYLPVHSERGIFVENTPPNEGFNHAILAIQLPDAGYSKPMPAIYEHPKLGRLLIFDPTNDLVPLGQLPFYEQDSFGLLVTEQGGELIHFPVSKPDSNRLTRTARLSLLPDGTLQGEVEEVRTGTEAYRTRSRFGRQSEVDRKKALERALGGSMPAFHLDSMEAQNLDNIENDLILRYKFTAEHYAKNAGPLLLVRPRVAGEKLSPLDGTKPRYYAYEFDSPALETDIFEISLPDGYKIDELPDPAKASFSFGEYNSKLESAGNVLKYSREYKITSSSVPPERIGDLKKFFHEINMDEKNMAVLKKGN
jgi:hypothetical protein